METMTAINNVLFDAARREAAWRNEVAYMGYNSFTTFFSDFSIAEMDGEKGVRDTYKRAFESWKTDYKYLTELVMVLNHKSWEHAESNPELGRVYAELFYEARDWGYDNLKDDELTYFWETLD